MARLPVAPGSAALADHAPIGRSHITDSTAQVLSLGQSLHSLEMQTQGMILLSVELPNRLPDRVVQVCDCREMVVVNGWMLRVSRP